MMFPEYICIYSNTYTVTMMHGRLKNEFVVLQQIQLFFPGDFKWKNSLSST